MRSAIATALIFALSGTASAGVGRWSSEVKRNPFTNSDDVTVSFITSERSGVFMTCTADTLGILIRIVPGYAYEDRMAQAKPTVKMMVDGKLALFTPARVEKITGDLAAIEIDAARILIRSGLEKFVGAQSQVAFDDGMSDRPMLLSAKGSTASGRDLQNCLED